MPRSTGWVLHTSSRGAAMTDEDLRKRVADALAKHVPMAMFRRRSINADAARIADELYEPDGGGAVEDAAAVDEAQVRREAGLDVVSVIEGTARRVGKKRMLEEVRSGGRRGGQG